MNAVLVPLRVQTSKMKIKPPTNVTDFWNEQAQFKNPFFTRFNNLFLGNGNVWIITKKDWSNLPQSHSYIPMHNFAVFY